jgi:hypothetical protein
MVSVIVRKSVCVIICVIVNSYLVKDVWIYKYKIIVNGNKEREII